MPRLIRRLFVWMVILPVAICGYGTCALAQDVKALPWEKYSLTIGYFISALDSSVRIGSGIGLDIDVEDALNLDQSLEVVRLSGMWRTGRHRLNLGWFAFHRSATRTLGEDIVIENPEGEEIVIEAGTTVDSFLDLDLIKLTYSYSFLQDDRIDLGFNVGLFLAPVSTGIESRGLVEEKGDGSFTAPLPLLGLRLDVALTPRWFIHMQAEAFYLKYENYEGSIYESTVALEFRAWRHLGIGLGVDTLRLKVQADDEDIPGVDFRGNIGFQYAGLILYAKAVF